MKVRVYRNLHNRLWSVVALSGENKGRVIAHMSTVSLVDARFVVRPAGRLKVIQERRKNVHAFVVGTLVGSNLDSTLPTIEATQVTYNPYAAGHFYYAAFGIGADIYYSPRVNMTERGKVHAG